MLGTPPSLSLEPSQVLFSIKNWKPWFCELLSPNAQFCYCSKHVSISTFCVRYSTNKLNSVFPANNWFLLIWLRSGSPLPGPDGRPSVSHSGNCWSTFPDQLSFSWSAEHKFSDQLASWPNVSWPAGQLWSYWLSTSLFNNNMGGGRKDGERGDDGEQGECD